MTTRLLLKTVNKKLYLPVFFTILICAITTMCTSTCMINYSINNDCSIIEQSNNPELIKLRTLPAAQFIEKNPNIKIIRKVTAEEKYGVCFDYAMQQATKITQNLFFVQNAQWISTHHIAHYFQPIDNPQKFDLVVHIDNKENKHIKHFSIIVNTAPLTLESKWGRYEYIFQHGLFDLPESYGNAITFWTLQEQYKSDEGKQLLIKNIKRREVKMLLFNNTTDEQSITEDELDKLIEENKEFLPHLD